MRSKMALGASMLVLALGTTPVGPAAALEPRLDIALPQDVTLPVDSPAVQVGLPGLGSLEVNVHAPVKVIARESGNVDVRQSSQAPALSESVGPPAQPAGSRQSRQAPVDSGCCYLGSVGKPRRVARDSGEEARTQAHASQAHAEPAASSLAKRSGNDERSHGMTAAGGRDWKQSLSNLVWDRYPDYREEGDSVLPDFGPAAATGSLPWGGWVIATLGGLLLLAAFRLRKLSS